MSNNDYMAKLLDGVEVEWKAISEIFHLKNGYTPSKSKTEYWANGTVPWFRMDDIRKNGQILDSSLQMVSHSAVKSGKLSPANSIVVSTSATIGEHALITVPYLSNQRFTNLSLKDEYTNKLDIKFIYYYCFLLDEWCKSNTTVSSFAGVDMGGFKKFQIPIPPLSIQDEIVRILDTFTELTAELTAELSMRKKQYNHYRDELLIFEDGAVEWRKLGDVFDINTGQKPSIIFETANNFDYINAGTSRSGYSEKSNCDGDTVTTPSRGQGGIGYVGYQDKPFWLGPLCYKIRAINEGLCLNKFLFYFLESKNQLLLKLKKEGGVPAVNKSDLAKLPIPIPPLEEQKRIVDILDKFDALTSSITDGLPREIELRKQQYEYYREILLSFPKPKVEV